MPGTQAVPQQTSLVFAAQIVVVGLLSDGVHALVTHVPKVESAAVVSQMVPVAHWASDVQPPHTCGVENPHFFMPAVVQSPSALQLPGVHDPEEHTYWLVPAP